MCPPGPGRLGLHVEAWDPVNGLEESPWKPGCLVATSDEGIYEICGDAITCHPIQIDEAPRGEGIIADAEPFGIRVSLFGLVRVGDGLLVAGVKRLYRLRADGGIESKPLPRFREANGVWVSFGQPGVVLVMTAIHAGRSTIGRSVPMVVPR
jgi:hypothetical protein